MATESILIHLQIILLLGITYQISSSIKICLIKGIVVEEAEANLDELIILK